MSANHFDPGSLGQPLLCLYIYCIESELVIAGWTTVIFLEVISY